MRIWPLLPVLVGVVGLSGAAHAGPRVTLKLENTTLHGALRGLALQTGYVFTGQGGLGQPGFKEPAGAQQARVDWKDRPVGKALRDLQNTFQVMFTPAGPTEIWVRRGNEIRRAVSDGPGVVVWLPRLQQSEQFRTVGGRDAGAPERRLSFSLALQATEGDADVLGSLTRLTLVDEAGRSRELLVQGAMLLPRLPDERRVNDLSTVWEGDNMARLRRLEGEIQLFDQVRELRVPVPLPAPSQPPMLPLETTIEGIRVRVVSLAWAGSRLTGRVRLEWAKDSDTVPVQLSPVRLLARLENGEAYRALSFDPTPVDENSGAVDLQVTRELPDRTVSLEILVAVRARAARTVPFHLDNLALPFGQPIKLVLEPQKVRPDLPATQDAPESNAPQAFRDPRGGSLRLPTPPAPPDGGDRTLAVGLRRQQGAGWSPTRWVELDADETPPRLTGLAPGTYRARLRVTLRRGDGTVQPSPESPQRTVTIRAGVETNWAGGK